MMMEKYRPCRTCLEYGRGGVTEMPGLCWISSVLDAAEMISGNYKNRRRGSKINLPVKVYWQEYLNKRERADTPICFLSSQQTE